MDYSLELAVRQLVGLPEMGKDAWMRLVQNGVIGHGVDRSVVFLWKDYFKPISGTLTTDWPATRLVDDLYGGELLTAFVQHALKRPDGDPARCWIDRWVADTVAVLQRAGLSAVVAKRLLDEVRDVGRPDEMMDVKQDPLLTGIDFDSVYRKALPLLFPSRR
jgi:hypothetical protein